MKTPADLAGGIKIVAAERPPVAAIPEFVRVTIIAVEPKTVVVVFDVEHFEVAIGIRFVRYATLCHCPLITLGTVFYSGPLSPLAFRTKYLNFLVFASRYK